MIAGIEDITGGTVSIGDRDVTHLHPGERGVAMGLPVLCALSAHDGGG